MMLWIVYGAAAVCEIAGCFAFWAWLRDGRSVWWSVPGTVALIGFAWLLTRVNVDAAGRVFAAYGGVYIAASLLWLWLIEHQRLSRSDMLGAAISLIGTVIILAGARARLQA